MGQARDEQGNIWETDAQGNAIRLVQQAGGQQAFGGIDPNKAYAAEDQQMQREAAARAAAAAENANRNTAAANSLAERKFEYEQSRRNDAPLTAKDRADAIVEYNKAIQLRSTINDLVTKYRAGPGATTGLGGAADFLPTPTNSAFDSAANKLRGSVKAAQGFTGGEGNTMGEVKMNIGPFIPSSWEYDSTTEDKLNELYNQSDNAVQRTVALLGGVPDQYGNVVKQPASKAERLPFDVAPSTPQENQADPMSPMLNGSGPDTTNRDALFGIPATASQNGGFAAYGSTSRMEPNPQFRGMNEAVKGMIIAGIPTPQIKAFMNQKGIAGDATTGIDEAAAYYRKTGKTNFGVSVENMSVPMSGLQQFANNAPQTTVGTGLAMAANAGGLGIPQLLAGGQGLDYLRSVNPKSALVGDVAGVIGGTSLIGRAGANVAGRLAPSLLGGGGKAAAGRQLATDATYGGIYGATTEGDPLSGALTAGVGSLGGQAIGTGIGKVLQGATMSAPAQKLRSLGVNNLTVGQMLGGKAKSFEDAMTSAPLIGDIVNARRGEGFQDFNLAALNQAGSPIGATVGETGENGLNQLMTQVGGAYDNATAGVNAPLDPQFMIDMQAASAAGQRLPPDYQVRFDKMGQNRVGPIVDAKTLTGETYQQSMRGLKGARSSAGQAAPGFEQDYRDAITMTMDGLKGQMQRGGGQSVIDGLAKADNSNRLGKTIERAMGAARNGTRSGEIQVFTPSQLNDAAYAAQKKYPGPRPFAELADAGQEVLPSQIPDSGTARRLTALALPASLGGVGGGLGFTGGDPQTALQGAGTGATIGALLALGGTKGGQKALEKLLFNRPKAIRRTGGIFGSRQGKQALSGLVTAPLLIE